jgi:hypothetical protein
MSTSCHLIIMPRWVAGLDRYITAGRPAGRPACKVPSCIDSVGMEVDATQIWGRKEGPPGPLWTADMID